MTSDGYRPRGRSASVGAAFVRTWRALCAENASAAASMASRARSAISGHKWSRAVRSGHEPPGAVTDYCLVRKAKSANLLLPDQV